jgi:hypothetical protein
MTRFPAVLLLSLLVTAASAQGVYPGDAVRVNGETVSYQRFQGFYVEYRNSKGVQVGARGDQFELLTQLRKEAMDLMIEQVLVRQAAEREGIEADAEEVDRSVEELRSVLKAWRNCARCSRPNSPGCRDSRARATPRSPTASTWRVWWRRRSTSIVSARTPPM